MRFVIPRISGISDETTMIVLPCFAMLIISSYISYFAPTSIPLVGSSIINTCGSLSSHFPKITFCWFPPERFEIISFGPIHFVRIVLISSAVAFSIFESERAIPDLYCFKFAIVVLNVRSPFKNNPFALRSSVIIAKPCSIASFALSKFIR